MFARLNTPVAAFAFVFADHDYACFFALAKCFFWAGCYAFGIFAASACQSEIK
jgi:hypothetical protein